MTTIRIRGLYAVALTQLFRQSSDTWEIVQPDDDVRTLLPGTWGIDSPEVDIDDQPDERGARDSLRLAGVGRSVRQAVTLIQQHCFDVIAHRGELQAGALYNGLVGIYSRVRRHAVVYLGDELSGILPMRYEDRDLAVGMVVPVRIARLPSDEAQRPELSLGLTVPGHYAVLTSVPAVRLSKQITDAQQRDRLQQLGEAQDTGGWGIVWRTAAAQANNEVLSAEVRRLAEEAKALRQQVQEMPHIGLVRGGEMVERVFLPGLAKAQCDALRAQLCPTLPGHHKYKAVGDSYGTTVDALEKELSAAELQTRTRTLGILSSIDAMQQPIRDQLRMLIRDIGGALYEYGPVERLADDLQAGWIEVRQPLRHKDDYPADFHLDKKPGDYIVIRFHEGAWSYTTRFHNRTGAWTGTWTSLTTPVAIFADQVHVTDLGVSVLHSPQHPPELRGMHDLERLQAQGSVTTEFVRKIRQEAEQTLQHMQQEAAST